MLSQSSPLALRAKAELELRKRRRSTVAAPKATIYQRYGNDPVAFTHDCFNWKEDGKPAFYQDEILAKIVEKRRASVRGPHGLGKTADVAWIVLWFALVNDDAGIDWKIPITASAWRQLTHFAMPEIHKWARRIKWKELGREPFNARTELLSLSLHLKYGEAFALASDNPASIEGVHASKMLYIFDESKTIPADTWDAAEGAFSTGECFWLSVSTPGEPSGRFYDIQSRKPGYEDWWVRHVTLQETLQAGRINQDWVESRKLQWGEESAVFQNRVLGEFASSDADGVIPLSWVEAANLRWQEWKDQKGELPKFTAVGVDIARSGEDKTVFALRYGKIIAELRKYTHADTMQTTGRVKAILEQKGGKAIVDVIGIGAGVFDRLREQGMNVEAFNASEHTDYKDASGEWSFVNVRSAAWWKMRELLDPSNEEDVCLPADDLLTGDLVSPHVKITSGGKIQIESKEDIKERIGRSTDDGDAVIEAFWETNSISAQDWTAAIKKRNEEQQKGKVRNALHY